MINVVKVQFITQSLYCGGQNPGLEGPGILLHSLDFVIIGQVIQDLVFR